MENDIRNEFSINWRIENFSLKFLDHDYWGISSPKCTAENLEKSEFILDLYWESEMPGDDKYLFCRLYSYLDDAVDETIPIEFTVEIIDGGGETLQSKTLTKFEVTECNLFEWNNIVKIEELLNKMQNWTEDTLTVRCRILGEVNTRQPKIECEVRTKIGVDGCSFEWKVNYPHTSDWSERTNFVFHDKTPFEITLSAPEDDVLINIQNVSAASDFVICRMSLIDIEGDERYSQISNYLFRKTKNAVWKFPAFFTKTVLEDNEDTLQQYGTFTLTCNFLFRNGIFRNKVRYRTLPLINAPCTEDAVSSSLEGIEINKARNRTLHLENAFSTVDAFSPLLDDWRNMFKSKKHADVELQVDNEVFPAHKCLLAVRSPVFSAMFDQKMLESQTGVVNIEDLDVKTMNSFLEFMYTGTVDDMDYDTASKLLIAAEKYQVLSLKEKCASFLTSILSEENVCEVIALSDMVGHELLKASSLDYIRLHKGIILRSPQWFKRIKNNVQLAAEIFCNLSTDIASGE